MKTTVTMALVAAFAATGALAQSKLTDDMVKIGVLTDMSGLYAEVGGEGAVVAAKMAIEDFGGKMLGKPIEIISADHQNKADIAANKAREWFDVQKVDMMAEMLNSAVGLAVQKVGAEKKRITMNSGAASSRLSGADCSAYGVHWTYDTYALAHGTGSAMVKQGGDSWYFLTADYAFGHSLEKDTTDVIKAAGGKVLGSVRHPLSSADFSGYLLQAQASKAKVIGLANAGGDTINSVKQANEFGITKGGQQLAGLLVFDTDIDSIGLQIAQGMYLTTGFYWDYNDDTRKWSKRFGERFKGKMPTMVQAGVYSQVTHYLKAVAAAGTDDADAVMKKMRETPVNDFFAKNGKLRDDGRMVHDMYLMQVKKPAESKGKWDYMKVVQTIPGDQAFRAMKDGGCPLIKK
ncbi:MAG: ABC transporter substrate-binding protein [Burkholderiales bacterium]